MLDKLCKELGVEVDEVWYAKSKYYKINEYGQVRVWNNEYDEWIESYYNLGHIITGELKPIWKPEMGDKYYFPYIHSNEEERYNFTYWENRDVDNWNLNNHLVFKTKDEAIECTNRMLNLTKEDKEC